MSSTLIAFSTLFTIALSAVVPLSPAPGQLFKAGEACLIEWTPDTTGEWKNTEIQLMSGENLNMIVMETVVTVDGTATSNFTWACPEVNPCADIYFYQFSNGSSSSYTWTGRFTIECLDGSTVAPPESVQNGESTPWGNGTVIQNFSTEQSVPVTSSMPPTVANGTSTSLTSATGATTSAPNGPAKTTTLVSSSSSSGSASGSANTGSGDSSKSSGAEKLVAGGVLGFAAAIVALL